MSAAAIAQPQATPAPTTPAPTAAPATATVLNGDTPIETLMAKPETKAILLKYVPEIENHPAYEQFKGMSLRQLQPLAGGIITDEKIAGMEADLKKLK
jgi:hypothetical protein